MTLFRMIARSSAVHPPDISNWIPFDPLWLMRCSRRERAVLAEVASDAGPAGPGGCRRFAGDVEIRHIVARLR
jgi:hypothetical protein